LLKTLERLRARRGEARGPGGPNGDVAIRTARAQPGVSGRLLVPQGEQLQLIDASAIHWLESDDNYVHVHTAQARYMLRRTLSDLLEQLGERFVRIHKSVAVNLSEVKSLSPLFKGDHEVHLRGGQVLRMSRRYKEELFGKMGG
ncbi:MAG: LytTR family DNA-binding domain-containing protein, partial [Peristeroidobacter soli]